MSGPDMWDARFERPDYVYGVEPNAFLAAQAHRLRPGMTALCVADGEGRNSVWLAGRGLRVTAFDASAVAVEKARRLAAARDVTVDFHVCDVAAWRWDEAAFDVVAAIFVQFAPPPLRARMFAGMARAVRPGGLILLQGYRPEQIAFASGGPRDPAFLYTAEMLADAFAGFDILSLRAHEARLDEGVGHIGPSALIDLIACRPVGADR